MEYLSTTSVLIVIFLVSLLGSILGTFILAKFLTKLLATLVENGLENVEINVEGELGELGDVVMERFLLEHPENIEKLYFKLKEISDKRYNDYVDYQNYIEDRVENPEDTNPPRYIP